MTFTSEVFEIIQSAITLKNNKTKRRLKAKITENLESEIRESEVPSYYFSVLTSLMDVEVPDEDIKRVQILLRPICRKYTIENIPTYLTKLFLEDCDEVTEDISDQIKEKLTDILSTSNLMEKETQEICDYCCSALDIVRTSMTVSYNPLNLKRKIGTVLFDTINCEDGEYESDDDSGEEQFLQVLETGAMISVIPSSPN